jgi:nitrate/TMAO reductase-like tetraheme cytochrome c subunit
VHQNKFGNDCRKCHNEFSFTQVTSLTSFNHEKTDFPLRGKHQNLDCKSCHKKSVTQALKHNLCTDCHTDYHEGQLAKNGASPDCNTCHSVNGFSPSNYTIEKHNESNFTLDRAHLATPCFTCHKPQEKWNFTNKGTRCIDCHENIHKAVLAEKYLPNNDCKNCHSTSLWADIEFDHNKTNYKLEGKHGDISCRNCHFSEQNEITVQQFANLSTSCENCHQDVHFKQFEVNKRTECENCHTPHNWEPEKFNHNIARFKLDGEHVGLDCVECHKPTDGLIQNYIVYKFDDITCASCH